MATTRDRDNTGAAEPMRNHDGSVMLNDNQVVYRSQFLSTHPLKNECMERIGSGGKILTYVTGDGVIRTMNAAFGHGGWSTEITRERQVACQKDARTGKWTLGYMATVRVSLKKSEVSHEDCGFGEGIDGSKHKALETAMKSAVTDAMKRAARHFGERLGNALYVRGSGTQMAPKDNKAALNDLARQEAYDLFGEQKALSELRATKTKKSLLQNGSSDVEKPAEGIILMEDRHGDTTTLPPATEARNVSLTRESFSTPAENAPWKNSSPIDSTSRPSNADRTLGFTKASDLGVLVTPHHHPRQKARGDEATPSAGQPQPQQHHFHKEAVMPSPTVSPNTERADTIHSEKHPRCDSLPQNHVNVPNGWHQQVGSVSEAASISAKRQKLSNPYQR